MSSTKKLLSNSSIVFIGTMVASVFSYLFNMLVGRYLGPERYGEFASIMSLMTILSVGGAALMIVVTKYSSDLSAGEKYNALKRLITVFSKYVLVIDIALFLAGLLFMRFITSYLSLSSQLPVAIALANFLAGFLIVINRGFLQGTQRFFTLTVTSIIEMLLRLLIGVFLVKIGLGTSGAVTGVVAATFIVYLLSFIPIIKYFKKNRDKQSDVYKFDKKNIINYSIPSLVTSVLLTVALGADVILVKHYFDPVVAGNYAAISTIAKIIFFAMGPVAGVMFPMITEKASTGGRHYKLFLSALVLTLAGSLIILAVYYVIPGTLIKFLYGQKYVSYYFLLPQIGFFVLLYSLINLMVNYFMAIKNYVFVIIFVILLSMQLTFVSMYHSSIEVFVKVLIITYSLLFVSLFGYYLLTKKEQLKQYFKGEYEPES